LDAEIYDQRLRTEAAADTYGLLSTVYDENQYRLWALRVERQAAGSAETLSTRPVLARALQHAIDVAVNHGATFTTAVLRRPSTADLWNLRRRRLAAIDHGDHELQPFQLQDYAGVLLQLELIALKEETFEPIITLTEPSNVLLHASKYAPRAMLAAWRAVHRDAIIWSASMANTLTNHLSGAARLVFQKENLSDELEQFFDEASSWPTAETVAAMRVLGLRP
jgi:hypothetical protein